MQPFQERVLTERKELREKLTLLTSFISGNPGFRALDAEDQRLLRTQRNIMSEYLDVLEDRIARFPALNADK